MSSATVQHFRHHVRSYAQRSTVHQRLHTRHYAQRSAVKSRRNTTHTPGGVFEPFLKPMDGAAASKSMQDPTPPAGDLSVKDVLPKDELLKILMTNSNLTMPIEKQKAAVQVVLETLQQVQPPKSAFPKLLELSENKSAELTALGNVILRANSQASHIALVLYECAMEAGDDTAAFSYANMLYRGHGGIAKDVDRGIQILTDLARKGHPYAQMNLAAIVMRTKEDGGKTAVQLYELAGRGGIDSAWAELGRMHRAGLGVAQDHQKAMEYFRKGAQSGNPQCNFMLGVYYSAPQDGSPADQTVAFKHFQKAAIKGMPEAQYNVGLRYFSGNGVEQNFVNAAEFYLMAAAQGFPLAESNLARMYYEGRGVKPSLEKAEKLWRKLAERGGPIGKDAEKCLEQYINNQQSRPSDKTKCTIM